MKRIAALLLGLCILAGCSAKDEPKTGDTAPTITILGNDYVAPYMPEESLPETYRYLRDLEESEANDTGLAGCHIYVDPESGSIDIIYLYQECGTPVDEDTVDSTLRQWAYVPWIRVGSEE